MLTSLGNPQVKDVVRLRSRRHRDREGRFLIEGLREVRMAVEARFDLGVVYYCGELLAEEGGQPLLGRIADSGVECRPTSRGVLEKMSYRRTPDGILCVAPAPALTLDRLPVVDGGLWLVAAAIEKPGNLGAMLRSADAAGAAGVLVADPATDVFNPNVVRSSVGALFSVPVAVGTAKDIEGWLDMHQIRIVAARPDADVDYALADLRGNLAIVVGSEHQGLGTAWAHCEAVRIAMMGRADSVNAATAAAVLLFEARRQRGPRGTARA